MRNPIYVLILENGIVGCYSSVELAVAAAQELTDDIDQPIVAFGIERYPLDDCPEDAPKVNFHPAPTQVN